MVCSLYVSMRASDARLYLASSRNVKPAMIETLWGLYLLHQPYRNTVPITVWDLWQLLTWNSPRQSNNLSDSMLRSNSRSKWMEVLGFDELLSSHENRSSSGNSPTYSSDGQEPCYETVHYTLPLSGYTTYPRYPRDITFFRSRGDILLIPSSPAPSPNDIKPLPAPPHLFYITIQRDPASIISTARPDLILHSGPSKASTVISFAKFHSVTQMTDITLVCTNQHLFFPHLASFRLIRHVSW